MVALRIIVLLAINIVALSYGQKGIRVSGKVKELLLEMQVMHMHNQVKFGKTASNSYLDD